MKKLLLSVLSLLTLSTFTACQNDSGSAVFYGSTVVSSNESTTNSGSENTVGSSFESTANSDNKISDTQPDDTVEETAKIRLSFDSGEAILALEDNAAAQSLLAQLPLTQEFEDFNSIEKICRLEDHLTTDGVSSGVAPDIADVTLYVPWNTLVFYYDDYGYNDDLIPIGHVESGMDNLAAMGDSFTVTMEQIDNESSGSDSTAPNDPERSETTNITLTSGDTVITATLDNSETTQAFLATLPRTISMNNYADREYYGRIEALPENGEAISDYENGDVAYYPAGPSFAVFFANADSSNQSGLIRMGKITSDLSAFSSLEKTAKILIEIAD